MWLPTFCTKTTHIKRVWQSHFYVWHTKNFNRDLGVLNRQLQERHCAHQHAGEITAHKTPQKFFYIYHKLLRFQNASSQMNQNYLSYVFFSIHPRTTIIQVPDKHLNKECKSDEPHNVELTELWNLKFLLANIRHTAYCFELRKFTVFTLFSDCWECYVVVGEMMWVTLLYIILTSIIFQKYVLNEMNRWSSI